MAPNYARFFCARTNTAALFKESPNPEVRKLAFLNGIRFLYLVMSLGGHWYFGVAVNSTLSHLTVARETTSAHWLMRNVVYRMVIAFVLQGLVLSVRPVLLGRHDCRI